jgi:hypothetical protein
VGCGKRKKPPRCKPDIDKNQSGAFYINKILMQRSSLACNLNVKHFGSFVATKIIKIFNIELSC